MAQSTLFTQLRLRMPLAQLALSSLMAMAMAQSADAAPYAEFDARFFGAAQSDTLDLGRFTHGNELTPGTYFLDVQVNGNWQGRQPIQVLADGDGGVQLCISADQASQWQIKLDGVNARANSDCLDLESTIPEFSARVNSANQELLVSVPHAWARHAARGYISPDQWEQGISAGFLNYNLNTFQSGADNVRSQRSYFGSFNAGVNLGGWRLRSDSSYNYLDRTGGHYTQSSLYAQYNLASWRSQLTLGRTYTPGNLFNSFLFTGMRLGSDDRMWPDSQSGFAPVVKGIADSNARVSIYQNGTKIHEVSVAPGPFSIDDLYNTGYAGDLEVVVEEADGVQKRFTVPYANISRLMRPGQSRYNLTAGRFTERGSDFEPAFAQATYQHGLSNWLTGYGGALVAEGYYAGVAGVAFNTLVGALSMDVTHSDARNLVQSIANNDDRRQGQSYRVAYSNTVNSSKTNIALAVYRFSSRGYLDFEDYARLNNTRRHGTWMAPPWNDLGNEGIFLPYHRAAQRNRLQVSINQPIGKQSSLFASSSVQDYWERGSRRDLTYQAGYSSGYRWGTLNVSVSRTQQWQMSARTDVMLGVNIPLGRSTEQRPTLSTSVTHSDRDNTAVTTSLQGTSGADRQFAYNVYNSQQFNDGDHNHSTGVSGQYLGSMGQVSAMAAAGSNGSYQNSLGLSGNVLAHSKGVLLSREQGDSFAIVHVPGAAGTQINGNRSRIGNSGFGVASNLLPYRNNSIYIDPKGSSFDVEVTSTQRSVAPTAGAIVRLDYQVKSGRPLLLEAERSDGDVLPLGAEVYNRQMQSMGLVGQGGRIFLRGVEADTDLWVRWGDESNQECLIHYVADTDNSQAGSVGFPIQKVRCEMLSVPLKTCESDWERSHD